MKSFTRTLGYLMLTTIFFAESKAQITYFEQDFNGSGPFTNPNPGPGEFTNLIETEPALAYIRFQNGAMEMIRTVGSNGGSVSAVRSVPFSPNPETLYIQVTLTVKDVSLAGNPAAFLYIGEDFFTNNIPNNNKLFSRPSIKIESGGFLIRDVNTNHNSALFPFNTPVTMTWVLNNSASSTVYKMPETAPFANHQISPQTYDIWVNETQIVSGGASYAPFSPGKLSNLQIRFMEGVGTISIDNIRIRDIDGVLPVRFKTFEATRREDKVQLNWEVEGSEESKEFLIERSADDITFTEIGTMTFKPEEGSKFRFLDKSPLSGVNYYRIIYRGANSEELAQSVVRDVVMSNLHAKSGVWPNPVYNNEINLYTAYSVNELALSTVSGRRIPVSFSRHPSGCTQIQPNSKLQPGLYLLTYANQSVANTLKILVLE